MKKSTEQTAELRLPPTQFTVLDPVLSEVCRAVQGRTAEFDELSGLELRVTRLESFKELPEKERGQVGADDPAAYRHCTREILVNYPIFARLSCPEQQAIMAHETAHALSRRDDLLQQTPARDDFDGEEFLADRLACVWGFAAGLREERMNSRGPEYVQALDLWPDEAAYYCAMRRWRQIRALQAER